MTPKTTYTPRPLTEKERRTMLSLSKRWAMHDPSLTVAQMLRCRRLWSRDDAERRKATGVDNA